MKHQVNAIECSCGFFIPNETPKRFAKIGMYLDQECPTCGKNLLTKKEYRNYRIMITLANIIVFFCKPFTKKSKGKGTWKSIKISGDSIIIDDTDDTIEHLIENNDNIELTETAIKQIGL